ncbi:MAG: Kdo hydroxylase family protein [Verrucomicrobia bacterium]|nr:Kdo hydroxylase family protein [Verrucomicrobiota bacterium]
MEKRSLEELDIRSWDETFDAAVQNKMTEALEGGKILYFPSLSFSLSPQELLLLDPEKMSPKSKNISFDLRSNGLQGMQCTQEEEEVMRAMIKRFAISSRKLLDALIPHYQSSVIQAKTSFRPVEIFGRKSSYRKDDTRLHVDSFPSNPVKGQRIMRVFTNINPNGQPRVWRAGEPFKDVVEKIAPRVSNPIPGVNHLLKLLKITKSLRTPYDHYMLQIHDEMKRDMNYQQTVPQEEIQFPPGSSWIVFTDLVSHAAMSGQHVLEQTFYLPAKGQKHPEYSPLATLERYFNRQLI